MFAEGLSQPQNRFRYGYVIIHCDYSLLYEKKMIITFFICYYIIKYEIYKSMFQVFKFQLNYRLTNLKRVNNFGASPINL